MWTRLLMIAALMGVLVGGLWKTYSVGYESGESSMKQKWDAQRAQQAEAQAEETLKARQRELALQALANRLRKEKADEAKRLAAEYAADIDRLRNRPESRAGAGGLPEGATTGVGCTGAGLSRPDAGFLTRLASDAARLQSAYAECRQKYTALERQLNGE